MRQIQRPADCAVGMVGRSKAVGGENKRNAGFTAGILISGSISHVYGSVQIVPTCDDSDIFSFRLSGVAGAQVVLKITAEACGLKKNLNIACLAVADNI